MATAAMEPGRAAVPQRAQFVLTIFFGSFLLFLVQPMIARMALPRLGGAPSVWNSAMLVYQALLLGGYAYAHWLSRRPARQQRWTHLALFAAASLMLPIGLLPLTPPVDGNVFLWVPWLLAASIGPLFFVVASQAPLIQSWYARSGLGDPYPLYAASNLGSFSGLLAYPLVVEPLLSVADQRLLWSGGYVLLALLSLACAFRLPATLVAESRPTSPAPSRAQVLRWIVRSAVPSGLVLAVTLHLTTDIVAVPLLWVVPLGLYLLSFSIAFAADRRAADLFVRIAPIALLMSACALGVEASAYSFIIAAVVLVSLLALCVAIHSGLYRRRPAADRLTNFYLAMSVGGVLGGIFCALLAPLLFDWTYEHLILLVAAVFLLDGEAPFAWAERWWARLSAKQTASLAVAVLALSLAGLAAVGKVSPLAVIATYTILGFGLVTIGNRLLYSAAVLALLLCAGGWHQLRLSAQPGVMTRSYFGIYAIGDGKGERTLAHGTTIHGRQLTGSPERERVLTSYYAPQSGVGVAMRSAAQLFGPRARIDVVGLGAGTLACFAAPGQSWRFFEIDPEVVAIARDPARFTFLSNCLPGSEVVTGDARLRLEEPGAGQSDILVVDAFSSDSVPMHLLTREAFDTYGRHIGDHGLLMVHISNRYLDLEPVVAAAAASGGWTARLRDYRPSAREAKLAATPSVWIAMSRDPATVLTLERAGGVVWRPLVPRARLSPWTDDRGSLLPLIRWSAGI